MKKINVLVATVALLAATAAANASEQAWFTLEGGGPVTNSTQGPGEALVITKGLDDVTLTIGYNVTSFTGAMAGYSVVLNALADIGKVVTVDSHLNVGAGYNTPTGQGNAASPTSLTSGVFDFGMGASNNDGGVGLVLTFELTITGKTDGSQVNIFGEFGSGEQGTSANVWYGTMGPNAGSGGLGNVVGVVYGYAGTSWGSLPVITINNVPEPATLALLGLGVVALIRRRR